MKYDPAHIATDEEIAKIEKLITKEYKKAHKEVSEKLDDYLARFANKDAKWQEWVKDGSKTEKEYIEWRKGQIIIGERWKEMRDTLAQNYANTSEIALSICKEYAPDVYALNHNYATFEVEKGSLLDTSYTLYSRESVERMYRDHPKLYHNYGKAVAKEIKAGKQKAWDRKRIQSVLMQGLLQGESIPKLTKRLEIVTKGDHNAAIRNARTMMTGVQNAGRTDAYDRANKMGIPVRKQWLATVDGRTRHWHRQLDGVVVDNDEPFENEFGKIMFPGDPEADGANVYNCRCTLLAAIKGFELDVRDPNVRPMPKLGDMTYEEWLDGKSVSGKINAPERKSGAIKGAWNKHYSGAGTNSAAIGEKLNTQISESYEYHRTANGLKQASYEEVANFGIVGSDMKNLSAETASAFEDQLSSLMRRYDTPLQKIRTATKEESLMSNSFAWVSHNYEVDSATMIINPVKCNDYEKLTGRIKELVSSGYSVSVPDSAVDRYVATHEFAHTLINTQIPLNNKRNFVGADYGKIKAVRKEVESLYSDYLKELEPLEKRVKKAESEFILGTNPKAADDYKAAKAELDKIKLSKYSLESADEFMAEAFTHSELSTGKNKYADKVRAVLDKYYGR